MSDLRKAAEMALEALMQKGEHHPKVYRAAEALRQALAHEALDEMVAENQRLGLYDDAFTLDRGCYERGCVAYDERDGDGVTISEKCVHKTDKSIHEPLCYLRDDIDRPFGGFEHCDKDDAGAFPVYPAPPKRDSSSWVDCTDEQLMEEVRRRGFVIRDAQIGREWVGLTDDERSYYLQAAANVGWWQAALFVENKLKEKNT